MNGRAGKWVSVEVPASSANLGAGYDVLALALELTLRVRTTPTPGGGTQLVAAGEGADRLRTGGDGRFVPALRRGLAELGAVADGGWRIEVDNAIPLGRGLGSSAAATVAGLLTAEALTGNVLGDERRLTLATDLEGHPDNAAAALHGGFVVVAAGHVVRYDPPAGVEAVLFVPELELSTAAMRHVLPATVDHADAVSNVGRAALVVSAFATGNLALLGGMAGDRLHEPYRSAVYGQFPALIRAALAAGALGAALSGAGSSVIALALPPDAAAVATALADAAEAGRLAGSTRTVALRSAGGRVVEE
ncbi:MAG TPA: homoserine kinase [Candidatus Limnocylindria bacterium]|nr:homoserine kinase [Candidatus Limnocylindria bacterium]